MSAELPDAPEPAPAEPDPAFERRIAHAEVNLRRVNEAIERGRHRAGPTVFVCECGRLGCTSTLTMTFDEYERIRTDADRFLVVAGHEIDGMDEVVDDRDHYRVIAKHGEAAEIAREDDPRTGGAEPDAAADR